MDILSRLDKRREVLKVLVFGPLAVAVGCTQGPTPTPTIVRPPITLSPPALTFSPDGSQIAPTLPSQGLDRTSYPVLLEFPGLENYPLSQAENIDGLVMLNLSPLVRVDSASITKLKELIKTLQGQEFSYAIGPNKTLVGRIELRNPPSRTIVLVPPEGPAAPHTRANAEIGYSPDGGIISYVRMSPGIDRDRNALLQTVTDIVTHVCLGDVQITPRTNQTHVENQMTIIEAATCSSFGYAVGYAQNSNYLGYTEMIRQLGTFQAGPARSSLPVFPQLIFNRIPKAQFLQIVR